MLDDPDPKYDHLRIPLAWQQYRAYQIACIQMKNARTAAMSHSLQQYVEHTHHEYLLVRHEVTPLGARRAGLPTATAAEQKFIKF